MPEQIRDGQGGGYLAGVSEHNRLETSSSTMPRIYYESRDRQNAFGITTPHLTITTTGGRILYVKNTSSTLNTVLTGLRISWNGGSTNHDRSLLVSVYFGDSAPTGNNTTGAAGNLNRGSNKSFDISVEYWDEAGDGMTIAGGSAGLNFQVCKGTTWFPVEGAIIIGPNDVIAFNLTGGEIGEASINILGFMEER